MSKNDWSTHAGQTRQISQKECTVKKRKLQGICGNLPRNIKMRELEIRGWGSCFQEKLWFLFGNPEGILKENMLTYIW